MKITDFNPDCATDDELEADRVLLAAMAGYIWSLQHARNHRLRGRIGLAMEHEAKAESVYFNQLKPRGISW